MNIIRNWCNQAGIQVLEMKSKRYNCARKRGYDMAMEGLFNIYDISESELDEWYEDYSAYIWKPMLDDCKASQRVATEMLRTSVVSFLDSFRALVAACALFALLVLLSAVGPFNNWHDSGSVIIFIAALALLAYGIMLNMQSNIITTLYEFYGFTEGSVAFADYRGYEKVDLSRLPKFETIIGDALY